MVCTIGPASRAEQTLVSLLESGMSIARLNFSHGTFTEHSADIRLIRSVARRMERPVPILVDLPGPKIRVGRLEREPVILERGATVTLTTDTVPGTAMRIPVTYSRLPDSVGPGRSIYLNDGFIELTVLAVRATEVDCRIEVGGPLLSGKGLNLPGATMFVDALSDRDYEMMDFALDEGITIFGISFVESAEDITKAKEHARKQGKTIYTVAKIERAAAVENIDDILTVTDAVMIARGDLGVELPIEDVPLLQKELILKANLACRPVITATQMLESMVSTTRPTRAEATDVANAILDGTDAVMLSEETAIGDYPVETAKTMARIAISTETRRTTIRSSSFLKNLLHEELRRGAITVPDVISLNVAETARSLPAQMIIAPTETGMTPRRIARFKPEGWIIAPNPSEMVRDFLFLSYGVYPLDESGDRDGWFDTVFTSLKAARLINERDHVIITEGKFSRGEGGTDSLAVITV